MFDPFSVAPYNTFLQHRKIRCGRSNAPREPLRRCGRTGASSHGEASSAEATWRWVVGGRYTLVSPSYWRVPRARWRKDGPQMGMWSWNVSWPWPTWSPSTNHGLRPIQFDRGMMFVWLVCIKLCRVLPNPILKLLNQPAEEDERGFWAMRVWVSGQDYQKVVVVVLLLVVVLSCGQIIAKLPPMKDSTRCGWFKFAFTKELFTKFFPRASERRVLPIVGVCKTSSHLHIFLSSHLHIFTSSHLHIFTSSHLHIFTSSHLHIFTSSHLHIFSCSHLLIFTSSHLHICSSSHLLTLTSSHLHILTSSHLLIFTSAHLHIFSSSHLLIFTSSHAHIFTSSHLLLLSSCPLALSFFSISLLKARGRGSANETARNATLSHEMRFDRQKLQ